MGFASTNNRFKFAAIESDFQINAKSKASCFQTDANYQQRFASIESDFQIDTKSKASCFQADANQQQRFVFSSANEIDILNNVKEAFVDTDRNHLINRQDDTALKSIVPFLPTIEDPIFDVFEELPSKHTTQDDCVNSIYNPALYRTTALSIRAAFNFQTGLALTLEAIRAPDYCPSRI
jgi:hypothetical protein